MKPFMSVWVVVCAVSIGLAGGLVAQQLPNNEGQVTIDTAMGVSFTTEAQPQRTVLLTGKTKLRTYEVIESGKTNTIPTEVLSMDLNGQLLDGSPVQFVAGTNFLGTASLGVIVSTNGQYPAESSYNIFGELRLPNGVALINTDAVQMHATIVNYPALSTVYTNLNTVSLVSTADVNTVVGQLDQLWFAASETDRKTLLGFSFTIPGQSTLGGMTLGVCPEGSATTATANIELADLSGPVTYNIGCQEFGGGDLLFSAKLNKDLRAPDWRGHHDGNWIIYTLSETGKTNLVAYGKMNGSDGVETHRSSVNRAGLGDCAGCSHFEGRLNGKWVDKSVIPGGKIEATYAGQFLDDAGEPVGCYPALALPPHGNVRLDIDGVVITKCLSLIVE